MVQEFSETCECQVSAKRMWHGLFKDCHNCLPKALPHKVLAVEYPQGQHDFSFPGAVRIIKFHGFTYALHKAAEAAKKFLEGEEEGAKEAAEKFEGVVHKEEHLVENKAEEAAKKAHKEEEKVEGAIHKEEEKGKEELAEAECEAHKESELFKEKVAEVGGAVHKEEALVEEKVAGAGEEVHKKAEEVVEAVQEQAEFEKQEVVYAGHKMGGAVHKAVEATEKAVHKEEALVAAALHKVEDFLDHVELEVKEKIEEVDHAAFKIEISVLAGGLVGVLFKHCKHCFEIKDKHGGGSILTWKSEFELLEDGLHLVNAFEEHKKHTLDTFHHVEDYLLKHGDYA